MRGYSLGEVHSKATVRPYVDIWEQPLWRRLRALAYHHWWERCTWRLLKLIEKPHEAMFNKNNDFFFMPLSNRQDIRCDDLEHSGRKLLARIYITPEQQAAIRKKGSTWWPAL